MEAEVVEVGVQGFERSIGTVYKVNKIRYSPSLILLISIAHCLNFGNSPNANYHTSVHTVAAPKLV